jgi:hypothetical protein
MAKEDKVQARSTKALIRDAVKAPAKGIARSAKEIARPGSALRSTAKGRCDDCRAETAFQAWHSIDMTPSYNWEVTFDDWNIVPPGKRAVIELVTAQIIVPAGEWARLRMYTSLGSIPSNLDLFLTFQGNVDGNAVYDATHSIRAYTDHDIDFDINRDNATTSGSALICISGYVVG